MKKRRIILTSGVILGIAVLALDFFIENIPLAAIIPAQAAAIVLIFAGFIIRNKTNEKTDTEESAAKLFFKNELKPSEQEKKNAHSTMQEIFGNNIRLESHYGPVQMDVWGLEYTYIPNDCKILIECERGAVVITVRNDKGEIFYPSMIYPEAEYTHWADVEADVLQLAALTHKALANNEIRFVSRG